MRPKQAKSWAVALVIAIATFLGSDDAGSAAHIRHEIGLPLLQAEDFAKQGDFSAALDKIRQAESVPHQTDNERSTISMMKNYVEAKARMAGH